MKNTKKNTGGVTGKGFDVSGQPSPEAKSKGWEERRQRQKLLDILSRYGDMTYREIKELTVKIKESPENYTLDEVLLANYMSRTQNVIDYLNRMGARAKSQVDITSNDETLYKEEVDVLREIAESLKRDV